MKAPRTAPESIYVDADMVNRISQLAEQLLREGHVDNEADARLAAIHILLATERDDRPGDDET